MTLLLIGAHSKTRLKIERGWLQLHLLYDERLVLINLGSKEQSLRAISNNTCVRLDFSMIETDESLNKWSLLERHHKMKAKLSTYFFPLYFIICFL